MRSPFQVLVIPFRRTTVGVEYAILQRSDAHYWQFVAGGGEDQEAPLQVAKREIKEEIGVADNSRIISLDSMATVPKDCFAAAASWGDHIFVIPEHCFAIDTSSCVLTLSKEHTELQWVQYEQARQMLKWDSNRNALWELNQRLKQQNSEPGAAANSHP